MNRTASEMMMIDKRRLRAQQIVARIVHAIQPHLTDEVEMRDVYDALYELTAGNGWEILTDEDRRAAGLPPRGNEGWTHEELRALEVARVEAILRPLVVPAVNLNRT